MNGYDNPAFESDKSLRKPERLDNTPQVLTIQDPEERNEDEGKERTTWNHSIEFLMSCIAMSVGFGNIWRFPFTAYENGGGAFILPYVILLFFVGKPFYFLEMILGQFSGSSSIKVWAVSPGFVGVGWAQFCSTVALVTYYSSLMALTLYFLIASFSYELPWARCREEWREYCIDSSSKKSQSVNNSLLGTTNKSEALYKLHLLRSDANYRSSAELYFSRTVLNEKEAIDDGIGLPNWKLALCLLGAWAAIYLVIFRGIKSSGRASYFLAIFPYVVLITLLIRAATLDGAVNGILFFVTPVWSKLLEPGVWYAAVTQCFFSLSVCFGAIITYSSHNNFKHNLYRDVMIVTSLDTVTSTIAGLTIFGILGNLAHEMDIEDIDTVVRSGAGLAFISYPDAIAKFSVLPQLFSVLFFVMMFVLGTGSAVGMTSGIATAISDHFPKLKTWQIVLFICLIGYLVSLVYITPGGQFILNLVDYYGTSFVVFILASFEITAVTWIYGLENFLDDVEFMLERRPNFFWRICWGVVTPFLLIVIFLYTIVTLSPLTYGGREYPVTAHIAGWIILCIGTFQIPIWMLIKMFGNRHLSPLEMLRQTFMPTASWGPWQLEHRKQWIIFKEKKTKERNMRTQSKWRQRLCVLFRIKPK